MDDITVSAVITESLFGNTDENIATCRHWVEKAAENGSRIVCFPELNISGYELSSRIESAAMDIPGPETGIIEGIAKQHGVLILAGMIEKGNCGSHITHIAVGPQGILGRYRKVHLSPPEKKYFIPGNEIPVFTWNGTSFAMGLCFDAHFPEFAAVCGLKGAKIIFYPHASPPPESAEEKRDRWLMYLPARAYDNSVFVVACNQVGPREMGGHFQGVAMIAGPRGNIIAETSEDKPGIINGNLKLSDITKIHHSKMGYFLRDRRPELYTPLTELHIKA